MKKGLMALAIVLGMIAFAQAKNFTPSDSNIMGYIASISRSLDMENIPFTKLAQQYIWNGPSMEPGAGVAQAKPGENQRPYIYVGGYWDTEITYSEGGLLTFICYVFDPDGYQDIARVEIYFAQQPTGVLMRDDGTQGDFAANDGVFGWQIMIPPNTLPAGQYLLEIVAFDHAGNQSDMWPYLTIN